MLSSSFKLFFVIAVESVLVYPDDVDGMLLEFIDVLPVTLNVIPAVGFLFTVLYIRKEYKPLISIFSTLNVINPYEFTDTLTLT